MTARLIVALTGLLLAGAGHVLLHDVRGASATWVRLDSRFPAAWRSSPVMAGAWLLLVGALCALPPALS